LLSHRRRARQVAKPPPPGPTRCRATAPRQHDELGAVAQRVAVQAGSKQPALGVVAGEAEGGAVGLPGVVAAAQGGEQLGAGGVEEVVRRQRVVEAVELASAAAGWASQPNATERSSSREQPAGRSGTRSRRPARASATRSTMASSHTASAGTTGAITVRSPHSSVGVTAT
jgi:hypothetical protein